MIWRQVALFSCASLVSLVIIGSVTPPRPSVRATSIGTAYSFNWSGAPSAPQSTVTPTWDTQIHARTAGDVMCPSDSTTCLPTDTMDAAHGIDCGAPPATHKIRNLTDGVFICNNHLMTAVGDEGYGEIALTPDHMADWSTGTTTIKVDVSTNQFNTSDWIELWLTPFAENQSLPFEPDNIDMQGAPRTAMVFSLNSSELVATYSGDVTPIRGFVVGNALPKLNCINQYDLLCVNPVGHPSVLSISSTVRTTYEIDISRNHIKFGLPGIVSWTDADFRVPFTRGIVQIVHHSYNPLKHDPGTGIDTFHWSNFYISNSVPFTIINGAERAISATHGNTVHFPQPAPPYSFLRFSGIGPLGTTYKVSWDGGTTWVSPRLQPSTGNHDEHFTTYFTPIPAGVQTVMFQGLDWWGGPWWVRDPAIWSQGRPPATQSEGGPPTIRPPVNQMSPPPVPSARA